MLFLKNDILPEEKREADKVPKKSSLFLAIQGSKVVQVLIFRTIFSMHPSRNSKATPRGVTRRDLWKSYWGQVLVPQVPHSGILVIRNAKGSIRVCEEV